jgi:hypothetical protein
MPAAQGEINTMLGRRSDTAVEEIRKLKVLVKELH